MSPVNSLVSIPLTMILPNLELPGDLHLFVSGHFIKYKNKGDVVESERFEHFVSQKMQYVFVEIKCHETFVAWAQKGKEEEVEHLVSIAGKENQKAIEAHQEIKDELLMFVTSEITDENILKICGQAKKFISDISQKKTTCDFLARLGSFNDGLVDHSTNVANLSTFLAINTGYAQHVILENIYMGALLHDIGKTKINPEYLNHKDGHEYKTAIKKHPGLGKTTLLLEGSLPDEVLRIIDEHHERNDGKGYPKGLKGRAIYELTKIVSIANVFDNLIRQNDGPIPDRQRKALKVIENDNDLVFDPKIKAKCVKALKKVI
jgi:putative nucleotidyltransferase with HDIG domain